MVDCKARLTEEILDKFNYLVDFMKIPENKKIMLENFGVSDFDQIYREKKERDLVYEKSKMTMYIENIGKKINSNLGNFIKKHIVDYIYFPDEEGNILCYDCDYCSRCYKCVDCVDCVDVYNSIKAEYGSRGSFNIDCISFDSLYISKKCEDSGEKTDEDLASCSILLDGCRYCKDCFNLKDCVECENCIDCIDCEDCIYCKDCKRCEQQEGVVRNEDYNDGLRQTKVTSLYCYYS